MAQIIKRFFNFTNHTKKQNPNPNSSTLEQNNKSFNDKQQSYTQNKQTNSSKVQKQQNKRDSDEDSLGYTQVEWDQQTINFQLQDRMLDCLQDEKHVNQYRNTLLQSQHRNTAKNSNQLNKLHKRSSQSSDKQKQNYNQLKQNYKSFQQSNSNNNQTNEISIQSIINNQYGNIQFNKVIQNHTQQQKKQQKEQHKKKQQKNDKKVESKRRNRFEKYKKKNDQSEINIQNILNKCNPQLQINNINQNSSQNVIDQIINLNLSTKFKKHKTNQKHSIQQQLQSNHSQTHKINNQYNKVSINKQSKQDKKQENKVSQSLIIVQQQNKPSGLSFIQSSSIYQEQQKNQYKLQSPKKYEQQNKHQQSSLQTTKHQQTPIKQNKQIITKQLISPIKKYHTLTPPQNIYKVINQNNHSNNHINSQHNIKANQQHLILPKIKTQQFLSITDQIQQNNHLSKSQLTDNQKQQNNIIKNQPTHQQIRSNTKLSTYPSYQKVIKSNTKNQKVQNILPHSNQQIKIQSNTKSPQIHSKPVNHINQQQKPILIKKNDGSFSIKAPFLNHYDKKQFNKTSQLPQNQNNIYNKKQNNSNNKIIDNQNVHKQNLNNQLTNINSKSPIKQKKYQMIYKTIRLLQPQAETRIPIFLRKVRRLDSAYPNLYLPNINNLKINNDLKIILEALRSAISVIQLLYQKLLIQKYRIKQPKNKIKEIQKLSKNIGQSQKIKIKILNQQVLDCFLMSQWETYRIQQIEYIKPTGNFKKRKLIDKDFQNAIKSYKQFIDHYLKQHQYNLKIQQQRKRYLEMRRRLSTIINFMKLISQDLYYFWLTQCNYPQVYYDFVYFLKGNITDDQNATDQIYAKLLIAQQYQDPISLSIIGQKIQQKIQSLSK